MPARSHGMSGTKIYNVWFGMRQRCDNPKRAHYADYGGRGITYDPAWSDFSNFWKWAQAAGYAEGLELDRQDNDGPYSPENCRFVTPTANKRNKRNNIRIKAFGEMKLMVEWVDDPRSVGGYQTLYMRHSRGGTGEYVVTGVRSEYR